MLSRIWLVNLGLVVFVVFFGIKAFGVWTDEGWAPPEIQAVRDTRSGVEKKAITKNRATSELIYESVASMNLFSPDRKEAKPEEAEQTQEAEEKPVDKPPKISGREIKLYGAIIMDDGYKSALISNPKPESGERNSKWVKVGDSMGDFKVTEIKKESVILAEGTDRYEVLLFDKEKTRRPTAVSKKDLKPTVIDTGPKEAPREPKIQPGDDRVESRAKAVDKKADSEPPPKGVHQFNPKPGEKYKVVDTPFGKIKVRDKD